MTTKRDLLRLDMALLVKATSMSADHILTTRSRFIILKPTTMDMERGLLSLDMATGLLLFMSSSRIMDMDITQHLMNMATISTRDPLNLDMAMGLLLFMSSSWIMVMAITQHLMNMDITSTKDLLSLDTTMAMGMGIHMSTKSVRPTMDLMDMRLSMTTGRDLLRLDMALLVKATSMSADHTLSTRLRFTTQRPIMATIKF